MRLWSRTLARDLARLRGRLLAVAIAALLGVALFAASYGSYRDLVVSYDAMYQRTAAADLTVEGGDVAAFADEARADPAVAAVATRTVIESYARIGDRRILARIVGMPTDEPPSVSQVMILAGSRLDAARPDSVLVERHLADYDGLAPGDTLEVRTAFGWERVEVAGVVASPEYLWPARSRQEVLASPENFGVLFAAQGPLQALAGGRGRQALVRLKTGSRGTPRSSDWPPSHATMGRPTPRRSPTNPPTRSCGRTSTVSARWRSPSPCCFSERRPWPRSSCWAASSTRAGG